MGYIAVMFLLLVIMTIFSILVLIGIAQYFLSRISNDRIINSNLKFPSMGDGIHI